MQTIEEYKEYTAQLEGEVKNWHDAYNASQEHVRQLMKENERLERERVEQNAIIETCANELEELRKHELQWDLDKAKIKELNAENESLKYSVATLETDLAMATRWRKFPEEKPKWGTEVLIRDKDGTISQVRFSFDFKWISWGCMQTCESDCVKYWMPLPKTPED